MIGNPTANPALVVTSTRILMVPAVMVLLLADIPNGRWLAAGAYIAAAATDSLDGWLARARDDVTTTGAFLDPLADKLLVTAALVSLVQLGDIPAWAAMVIIAREFAVTGLRLIAAGERLVISANWLGKAKTVAQNLAVVALIAPHAWKWADWPLLIIALVLTIVSGIAYFVSAGRQLGDGETA